VTLKVYACLCSVSQQDPAHYLHVVMPMLFGRDTVAYFYEIDQSSL
jgi:hypothetical protein